MTEKYPKAWRDACLDLLKAHRAELHRRTGYKRMSWEPIRNAVMQVHDEAHPGKLDDRLIKHNFESWSRGSVLNDEKFYFIDSYVRRLAINGEDVRAMRIMQEFRFCSAATVLESLYVRADGCETSHQKMFTTFPWTLLSHEIEGT